MRRLERAERIAVGVWLVLAIVVWNGIYDLLLTRGIKDYVLRNALHQAGRGPEVSMTAILDFTVAEAFWVSTLWASVILCAGLWTVRLVSARLRQGSGGQARSTSARLRQGSGGPARGTSHVARRT
jgi:hypothetical protein